MTIEQDFVLLKNQLAVALERINELEEWRAFHNGLAFGSQSLTSPHPFLSIDTAEYGGRVERIGPWGIQIKAPTQVSGIYGLKDFVERIDNTGPYPRVDLFLKNDGVSPYIGIETLASGGGFTDVLTQITPTTATAMMRASFDGTGNDAILTVQNTSAGRKSVGLSGDCVFFTGVYSSDPSFTLADGDEWFRSDTFKKKVRANGVTENAAFESWVTAAIAAAGGGMLGTQILRKSLDPTAWAVGANNVATISGGAVRIEARSFRIATTCGSGGAATVSFGNAVTATRFTAVTAVANMIQGIQMFGAAPTAEDAGNDAFVTQNSVSSANIIATVAGAVFNAGAIEMVIVYTPITSGASMA